MPEPRKESIQRFVDFGDRIEKTHGGFRPSEVKKTLTKRKKQVSSVGDFLTRQPGTALRGVSAKLKTARNQLKRPGGPASKAVGAQRALGGAISSVRGGNSLEDRTARATKAAPQRKASVPGAPVRKAKNNTVSPNRLGGFGIT